MGVCYLMNPLHHQISYIVHGISYILESPNNVLSHRTIAYTQQIPHEQHDHHSTKIDYENGLINIIDSLFDNTKNKHASNKSNGNDLRFDKHFITTCYPIKSYCNVNASVIFWIHEPKCRIGYPNKISKPPKYSLDNSTI